MEYKLSPSDWVYATKHVFGVTYVSFAQAQGDVEEPRSNEHIFLNMSLEGCVEYCSTVYVVVSDEQKVVSRLNTLGFSPDETGRVTILDYLEGEGLLEEDAENYML